MLGEAEVLEVEPRRLAVVRRRCSLAELPATILSSLDIVWPFLKAHRVPAGQNVVLYHDQLFNLDIGVEVFASLPQHDTVVSTTTPGRLAATVTHWGPYEELTLAHTAIARHCIGAKLKLAGPNWEVYGDWEDDPEKRRTDVFYQLLLD